MGYNFFMAKVDKDGNPVDESNNKIKVPLVRDLENDVEFVGLRYKEAKGIENIGKAKNIYKETYADSDKLRTYVPDNVCNANTSVELTLLFVGNDRQKGYDAFNEYIRNGYHKYWDNLRNKEFIFYVEDEIKPNDDKYANGIPYIEVTYKLTNIKGKTEKHIKNEDKRTSIETFE